MRPRNVMIIGGAGAGQGLGAAIAAVLSAAPREKVVPRHPRELRDAPRTEGRAQKVKDWEFRQGRGRRPR